MNHTEATQHIKAALTAFGPGEAISMTQDTWATLHEAMSVLIEKSEPAQEPVAQWRLSKDGLPPVGSEVIGGYFYTDTWLKGNPEVFAWGLCRVIADDHRDFPDGKRWQTFGPSHAGITHWCWPPKKPGNTTPQPQPAQRTWVGLTPAEVADCIKFPSRNLFARDGTTSQRIAQAIEAKLKEKNT